MSCSQIRNFTTKITVKKTFADVSSENNPTLVTAFYVTDDGYRDRKGKRKRKQERLLQSFWRYTQTQLRLMAGYIMSELTIHPEF